MIELRPRQPEPRSRDGEAGADGHAPPWIGSGPRMLLVGLAALAALAACRKDGRACAERAAEVGRFLSAMERSPQIVDGRLMVVRADLPKVELRAAPVVNVRGREIDYVGRRLEPAELAERLDAEHRRLVEAIDAGRDPWRGPAGKRRVLLMFDEAATWDRVVAVVDTAVASGLDMPELVFRIPSSAQPPPRSAVDDELDRIEADPAVKATRLAEVMKRVLEGCPALWRSINRVGAEEGDKGAALIARVEPDLIDCNCAVDVGAVRSVMWRVLTDPHPVTTLALQLDRGAKPIELPASTPWREASKQFTRDGARAVALRVRP